MTFLIALLFSSLPAFAKDVGNIPEIGRHQSILIVEKNVNPENILVVYTKTDGACRLETDPANRDQPIFDFYWLLDGTKFKHVNRTIKNEIRKRFEFQQSDTDRDTRFTIKVNDLKEMDTDIEHPEMDVIASARSGVCDVQAFMNLGPSDGNARIRLDSVYTEGRAFPPKVYNVTLKGVNVATGAMVERFYKAKE